MRSFCLLVAAVAACVAPAAAQAPPLTLTAAVAESLARNPELVALRAEYEAARALPLQERFLDAPMLEAQIWEWPLTTLNPAQVSMYMFMIEQELPGRGKRAARELVASREAVMSLRQIAVRANDIAGEVKQAYADLALVRERLLLFAGQAPVLQDMADAATLRYAAGHAGQHDTVQSLVEYARLRADEVDLRADARSAEARLNTLLGRDPAAEVGALAPAAGGVEPADAERVALERHPELAMADAVVAREQAELDRLRGERRPDFVVGGGYMLTPGEAGAWTARAGISWPNAPWSRGRLTAAAEAQGKKVEAARARRDVVASAIRRSVREASLRLEAARERLTIIESTVLPHAEHAFEIARVAYGGDRGEFADLLDTRRGLLEARLELAAARTSVERARADLDLAVGAVPVDGAAEQQSW